MKTYEITADTAEDVADDLFYPLCYADDLKVELVRSEVNENDALTRLSVRAIVESADISVVFNWGADDVPANSRCGNLLLMALIRRYPVFKEVEAGLALFGGKRLVERLSNLGKPLTYCDCGLLRQAVTESGWYVQADYASYCNRQTDDTEVFNADVVVSTDIKTSGYTQRYKTKDEDGMQYAYEEELPVIESAGLRLYFPALRVTAVAEWGRFHDEHNWAPNVVLVGDKDDTEDVSEEEEERQARLRESVEKLLPRRFGLLVFNLCYYFSERNRYKGKIYEYEDSVPPIFREQYLQQLVRFAQRYSEVYSYVEDGFLSLDYELDRAKVRFDVMMEGQFRGDGVLLLTVESDHFHCFFVRGGQGDYELLIDNEKVDRAIVRKLLVKRFDYIFQAFFDGYVVTKDGKITGEKYLKTRRKGRGKGLNNGVNNNNAARIYARQLALALLAYEYDPALYDEAEGISGFDVARKASKSDPEDLRSELIVLTKVVHDTLSPPTGSLSRVHPD